MRFNTDNMFRFCINYLDPSSFMCKHSVKSINTKIYHKLNEQVSKSKNDVDYLIHKESDTKHKEENVALLKSQKIDKLYKIAENLHSFSIFGSEIANDYGIKYEGTDENFKIPSVTRILKETMSLQVKQALEIWKKRIINTFGEDYFTVLCKELLNDGKLFHSYIQDTLLHKQLIISPSVRLAYFSVKPILDDIKSVKAVEAHVVHPTLRYQGVVDCIACYRNNIYVIDWKKMGTRKTSVAATFNAAVQLAAYIGAVNACNKYPPPIDRGLVIVGYSNGDAATIHELKKDVLQKAWREWLRRLEQFYNNLNETNQQP